MLSGRDLNGLEEVVGAQDRNPFSIELRFPSGIPQIGENQPGRTVGAEAQHQAIGALLLQAQKLPGLTGWAKRLRRQWRFEDDERIRIELWIKGTL
jgi:hypothetical protein